MTNGELVEFSGDLISQISFLDTDYFNMSGIL